MGNLVALGWAFGGDVDGAVEWVCQGLDEEGVRKMRDHDASVFLLRRPSGFVVLRNWDGARKGH